MGITEEVDKTSSESGKDDTVLAWSEEWNCYICSVAPKRPDQGAEEPEAKRQRMDVDSGGKTGGKGGGKSKGGKTKGGGPCWQCNGPHFQRECPLNPVPQGKGALPTSQAWSSWRPGPYPGPTPQQWGQMAPWKAQFKGKGKAKGSYKGKGKGGKLGEMPEQQPWQQAFTLLDTYMTEATCAS